MRYGAFASEDGQPDQNWHATVQNDVPIESQRLALRHARAMAAVLRAAKAWGKCIANGSRWVTCRLAEHRLEIATARLVAVEREVKCG